MSHISLFGIFTLIKTCESVLLDSLANNPLTLDLDAVITGAFLPENMATHVMQNTINYLVTSLFWGLLIIILVRNETYFKPFLSIKQDRRSIDAIAIRLKRLNNLVNDLQSC